ncbi:MAG TPA: type IV pilin protein [Stenotrophobium sp.]|nr:type IV pilin protein [Stenotrophobium sp.]
MEKSNGFTLIELLITVAVVGVLAAIVYPVYTSSITKTHRRAAEACLSNYASYMERFYTANMRYDQDASGNANTLPVFDCASTSNTGKDYSYTASTLSRTAYTLSATPVAGGAQASRDAACGALTLNQAGTRGVGSTATVADCW